MPGDQVGADQLRQLYADLRPEAFEQFVAGLWTGGAAPAGTPIVVQFDTVARRIAIEDGDTIESFVWRDTVRTLFDRVVAVTENEAVPSMRRTFSIRATGGSAIAVSMHGDNDSDSRELALVRLGEPSGAAPETSASALAGEWAGAGGLVVRFDGGRITWTDAGAVRRGTWVSFPLGRRDVLTVRFQDGPRETRSWLLAIQETRDKAGLHRRITLSPVSLTADGWEETTGDPLQLAQSATATKP